MLKEAGLTEDDGEIFTVVSADDLLGGLFALGQGIIRVEDMSLWTRNRVANTFYDDLREIIERVVPEGNRVESYAVPGVPDSANYLVDHMITTPGKPLYIFGVLNKDKARLATIILQHLSRHAPGFDSMVVYANMDDIPKPDSRRLLVAANDVVPSIHDREAVEQKIRHRREAA